MTRNAIGLSKVRRQDSSVISRGFECYAHLHAHAITRDTTQMTPGDMGTTGKIMSLLITDRNKNTCSSKFYISSFFPACNSKQYTTIGFHIILVRYFN